VNSYSNFTEAYVDLCKQIRNDTEYVSSPRGMKIKENLGVQFRIMNPRDRLPRVAARNFSLAYFVAETLWYLNADDSTEWISYYAPFWSNISDNNKTANSAYGARIFKTHPRIGNGNIVQWDYVKEELRKDPDSRRAVIHIRTPSDSILDSKDVPCTLSLQFFIRENKLSLHVSMRSSDIILGLAYDVPAFTTIQEILANELGVELGEYVHTSNSLHCYERDFEMLDAIANTRVFKSFGAMPAYPSVFPVGELIELEDKIRKMTDGEIRDYLPVVVKSKFSDPGSLALAEDWSSILLSNRARKMKDEKLSRSYILGTNHNDYHYFKR